MSNNTESYLENLEKLSPDLVLSRVNVCLPGFEDQTISLPIEDFIPDPYPKTFTITEEKTLKEPLNINEISSLKGSFSNYYTLPLDLISICGDQTVLILDSSLNTIQKYVHTTHHEENFCLSWGIISTKVYLAIGGSLGNIFILNISQGKFEKTLKGHMKAINCISFKPKDCDFLLTGSDDLTIRLWNMTNSIQVCIFASHLHGILTIDWHYSQDLILSGGKDSCLKLWPLKPTDELQEFSKSWEGKNFPTKLIQKPIYSNNNVHLSYIDCAKFYGNLIISKAQEGKLIIWKPGSSLSYDANVLAVIDFSVKGEIFMKFSFCVWNNLIIVGGLSGEVYVYYLTWAPQLLYKIDGAQGIARSVCISQDCILAANHLGEIAAYWYK
jgi:WD domain, G-beta repeat